jgi:hypothetical protein
MSRRTPRRPRPIRIPRPSGLDPTSPLGINIPGRRRHQEIRIDVTGPEADELKDAVSVFWDLLIADMACHHARSPELAAPGLLYARRACWETAVIAYSRCFVGGRGSAGPRAHLLTNLVSQLDREQRECHDYVLGTRGGKIAHHIDGAGVGSGRVYLSGSPESAGQLAIGEIGVEWSGEFYDLPILERLGRVVFFMRTNLLLEIDRRRLALFDLAREDFERVNGALSNAAAWHPRPR